MLCFPSKLSAAQLCIITTNNTLPISNSGTVIKYKAYSTLSFSPVRNTSHCIDLGHICSSMGRYYFKAKYQGAYLLETPDVTESCKGQIMSDIMEGPTLTKKMKVSCHCTSKKFKPDGDSNEIKRRSHLNNGRVPWNKGRKHSEETRHKIRQRTKEAMKDPKVRKKMSECPRALSYQTKARIRASLMKLWGKRLQWKRSREKFFQSWAESIAIAAKIGGNGQQELDWDSYEEVKEEIVLQQLHQVAEKVKAKEMARIKAEKAAQLKAEKIEMVARKREEWEENAKARGESTRRNKKSKEDKEKLAEFQGIKLKERLTKIHKKKSRINEVSSQNKRTWEKFDLDFVKGEQLHNKIPLADQIRLAKNRSAKAEQLLD